MTILPAPKFIPNSPDGTHCGPAIWRMVLETFYPEQDWSFEKIDVIIRKEPGKFTWGQTFYPAMLEAGVNIHAITTWDEREFIARTWDYVRERSGEESARNQQEHAQDLDFVKGAMQKMLDDPRLVRELRPATFDDLAAALAGGAYVGCTVNSRVLNEREGFNSHSVLVYGLDDTTVHFADPGPLNNGLRTAERPVFARAWGFNGPDVQTMSAFSRRA